MCGIVGFINTSDDVISEAENCFKHLLWADQLRGQDATGIAWMNESGKSDWVKFADVPEIFFSHKRVRKSFTDMSTSKTFAIGHNRARTFGANTHANAHPFHEGTIIGVHNGTLKNKHALCHEGWKCDVDSQALIRGIDTKGIDQTIKNADGALAVAYLDTETQTLNFIRNKERPLWFVDCTIGSNTFQRKCTFFASELLMLRWIVTRAGFTITEARELQPLELNTVNFDGEWTKRMLEEYKEPVKIYNYADSFNRRFIREYDGYDDVLDENVTYPLVTNLPPANNPTVEQVADKLDEVVPWELEKSPFLLNPAINMQTKRHFVRKWRGTHVGDKVNFCINDMTALGSKFQVFGRLAGVKNKDIPIIVSTILSDALVNSSTRDTIFKGTLKLKQIHDKKTYEYIVDDVEKAFEHVPN